MDELALKVENVSKEYRLGTIGGGTLKGEIQSKMAKLRKKEDPNLKIGEKAHDKNERFLALDDLSFEIKKGETVGILGSNGAGKSTILKLICRVTAPTKGNIYINGRITSMLEVGTGFHNELTGRENVYLNGAILGMSKAEIDKKYDEIVAFSEVGKFIDTPMKRYSSGMKVKLGFAVASHLDSEIMIMDEVLAVGDVTFQNKCIARMKKVASEEGKTILYVSHNMATVRSLCDRCIVLSHGKKIFEGDTEQAIAIYSNKEDDDDAVFYDVSKVVRGKKNNLHHFIESVEILGKERPVFGYGEDIYIRLKWKSEYENENLNMKMVFYDTGVMLGGKLDYVPGENQADFKMDSRSLFPGSYQASIRLYGMDDMGNTVNYDEIQVLKIIIEHSDESIELRHWFPNWGHAVLSELEQIK